ncbi:MAG: hypothetical protein WC725_03010 [Patescibacteria group bacterium]|jgi:hypothetical protein
MSTADKLLNATDNEASGKLIIPKAEFLWRYVSGSKDLEKIGWHYEYSVAIKDGLKIGLGPRIVRNAYLIFSIYYDRKEVFYGSYDRINTYLPGDWEKILDRLYQEAINN